jgi:predicted nucleic acid-binding protein
MIILDTNVVSELMKSVPSQTCLEWFSGQVSDHLYMTSITVAEVIYGHHLLPQGKRHTELERVFELVVQEAFSSRLLPFDDTAAHVYGEIMAKSKYKGKPMSTSDGQIAAIAMAHKFYLATRNTKDFQACGVPLINPFDG